MNVRYPAAVLVTSLLLVCSAAGAPKRHVRRPHAPAAAPAAGLYSPRALRRTRLLIQMQLLELRKARLERVRKAIEHRLPVEDILRSDG